MRSGSVLAALLLICILGFGSETKTIHPKTNNNELLLPSNYRDWVKLSPKTAGMPSAHRKHLANQLYVEPAAFEHFSKTGEWPNKTVIVMELIDGKAGKPEKSEVMGLEAAVKGEGEFPGAWSFYGIVFDHDRDRKDSANSEIACASEPELDSRLAIAFPTLRSVINAKPWTMSPMMF